MLIINILFCIFSLVAALNFFRNISQASGIDNGTRAPDAALITCASPNTRTSSESLQFNFGIYALWVLGIVAGALFYIFADESWGGIVAAIAGIVNVFSIRGILGATRRFMDRYTEENFSHFTDLKASPLPLSTNPPPSLQRTATSAIADGSIAAPPELSQEMIAAHTQLANAQGKQLVPVRHQTKYEGQLDSPTLLIHGDHIFELVDEYDPATGSACLAAARDDTWFRFISSSGSANEDAEFLTWRLEKEYWRLVANEQYLA